MAMRADSQELSSSSRLRDQWKERVNLSWLSWRVEAQAEAPQTAAKTY
jgi:hypothetical protein